MDSTEQYISKHKIIMSKSQISVGHWFGQTYYNDEGNDFKWAWFT